MILRLILLTLIQVSLLLSQTQQIAVVDFEALGVSTDEARALTNRLVIELHRTNKFMVLEREMLEKIIEEQKFQLSGCNADQCLVELGQIANVQQIVGGTVSKVGEVFTITTRLISVESGAIVESAVFDHTGNIGVLMKSGMQYIAYRLAMLPLPESPNESITEKIESKSVSIVNDIKSAQIAELLKDIPPYDEKHELAYKRRVLASIIVLRESLIEVEGGSFIMGDNSPSNPFHEVSVDNYEICQYEITQEQYIALTGRNPSKHQGLDKPVESVSWFDAIYFCNKLSIESGYFPCYTIDDELNVTCDWSANGYRLPTEAEWEFAAIGGRKANDIRDLTTWDIKALHIAWCRPNSNKQSWDVGLKYPNVLELYDMSGNVLEWCWDWYDSVESSPLHNPRGKINGEQRIRRGGGYYSDIAFVTPTYRFGGIPDNIYTDTGFRIARKP